MYGLLSVLQDCLEAFSSNFIHLSPKPPNSVNILESEEYTAPAITLNSGNLKRSRVDEEHETDRPKFYTEHAITIAPRTDLASSSKIPAMVGSYDSDNGGAGDSKEEIVGGSKKTFTEPIPGPSGNLPNSLEDQEPAKKKPKKGKGLKASVADNMWGLSAD
ncbi:hypothetical protein M422DRAFT_249135 [Sphaerobolus stellatus SS14]|nr:hypothetical protein M422DRAFT_249135 [Sphaerobolus stellatus SS14]